MYQYYMDNTVGSLTQLQKSVIIGSLLGDGYLRIVPDRKDAFLEVNHSIEAKEYVDWKFNILKDLCISPPKKRKGNGRRIAYRFFTKQHPELSKMYRQFYRKGKKIIPPTLKLDPLVLGIWWMDDGSMCGKSDFYFNTQQFSLTDQKRLLEKIKELGLEAKLNRDKKYYRIRLLLSSVPRLRILLRDILIPSMYYKLGYNPVET